MRNASIFLFISVLTAGANSVFGQELNGKATNPLEEQHQQRMEAFRSRTGKFSTDPQERIRSMRAEAEEFQKKADERWKRMRETAQNYQTDPNATFEELRRESEAQSKEFRNQMVGDIDRQISEQAQQAEQQWSWKRFFAHRRSGRILFMVGALIVAGAAKLFHFFGSAGRNVRGNQRRTNHIKPRL